MNTNTTTAPATTDKLAAMIAERGGYSPATAARAAAFAVATLANVSDVLREVNFRMDVADRAGRFAESDAFFYFNEAAKN